MLWAVPYPSDGSDAIDFNVEAPPRSLHDDALRFARTCYDHVAGRLGWRSRMRLSPAARIVLTSDGGEVTALDARPLSAFDALLPGSRRIFCRPCL